MRGEPIMFYHSINKKPLVFFGKVNKTSFDLILTFTLATAFSGRFINIFADVVAAAIFIIGIYFAEKLSKIDPQIMEVYRRHIHYKSLYVPISGIHAPLKIVKPSVPFYERT
jgi:type IV secretory pathway TrbD component